MSVKVRSKGKTYILNREEFQKFMKSLWDRVQAHKAYLEDKGN